MSDLQHRLLARLDADGKIDNTLQVDEFKALDSQQLQAALTSLAAKLMVTLTKKETDQWNLTDEAKRYVAAGATPEIEVVKAVLSKPAGEGMLVAEIQEAVTKPIAAVGQGKAFKNKWLKKDGDRIVALVDSTPTDTVLDQLNTIASTGTLADAKELQELKKRKLVTLTKIIGYQVEKGPEFSLEIKQLETDITLDMIVNGTWKEKEFKPLNFVLEGIYPQLGALHPLNKVKEEFRQIFFLMGFTEMPSNQYTETGFWNFDTLFVPQQHPARDLQDTFYLKDPAVAKKPEDETYWKNIQQVHQEGKYGSIGYRYPWKAEESLRMVLRTHTTAISAAMLHKLAQDPKPVRLFSIDRVFRNEAVDATHLAEFHQVEGVIAGYDITLGDLIGFMEDFFGKMGVDGLRFKAAYNPYTEPSLEIFAYHKGLGKWVEIGNSGMFRPEMLEAMGLPKNMRVLGWGLSLERPTMIKYGVLNIRELVGHKVSLDFVETNPAARLDELL